jgi:hypothetical protein
MDPHLRASDIRTSDVERQQVIDTLTGHTAAGRLTLDEFAARVDAVNRSKTYGQLAAVTVDLPTTGQARPAASHRPALIAFAATAVLLTVLLAALLVTVGAGWGHMNAMMAPMSAAMGCR